MINKINTIIEDLTNSEKSLGSVFLKVQVLAHQLRNDKLKDWVNNESNGYDKDMAVPAYRVLMLPVFGNLEQDRGFGNAAFRNNIQLDTFNFEDNYKINILETKLREGVSTYEEIMQNDKDQFITSLPPSFYGLLSEAYINGWRVSSAWKTISKHSISTVLHSIKSNLLQFMLDIADEIGEGSKIDIINKKNKIDELFEKNLGSGNTYNINTGPNSVQNVALGDNTNTNIAHGSNNVQSINNNDLDKLKDFIELLNRELNNSDINRDDLEDIKTQISAIETQLKRDKPNHSILKGAFEIIKGLVIGIGSNMIPELILEKMNGIVI